MTEIKLTKRYPQSRTEDIVDAYMRGWNDALDAVQNGKFIINDDRKTESNSEKPNNLTISKMEQVKQRSCDTCKGKDVEGWKNPCLGCTGFAFYEPKDEPQTHDICTNTHECVKDTHDKTENSSEKPNNCEHITEDGVTCARYPACDDCPDNPLNKVKGSERLVKGSEQTERSE